MRCVVPMIRVSMPHHLTGRDQSHLGGGHAIADPKFLPARITNILFETAGPPMNAPLSDDYRLCTIWKCRKRGKWHGYALRAGIDHINWHKCEDITMDEGGISKPLDTGIRTINDDHSKLFRILAEVRRAIQGNDERENIVSAIMTARDLFHLHCGKEEFLMREANCDLVEGSARDHRLIAGEFDKLVENAQSIGGADLDQATRNLMMIIVKHIMTYDREYAREVNESLDIPDLGLMMFQDVFE